MHQKTKYLLASGMLAGTLALAGCTDAGNTAGPKTSASDGGAQQVRVNEKARELLPAAVRDRGTLVIASDPSYAPFEYHDTDNTTMIGWDIDLGDAIGAALGLKVEHRAATFDGILPGLSAGKFDAGLSAFGVTEERQRVIDFVPNLRMGTGLAVKPGNPKLLGLDSPGSLCGASLAAQKGSLQGISVFPAIATDCADAGKPAPELKLFPAQTDANLALASGRVDGVLADSVPLDFMGKAAGGFELAPGADFQPEVIGMALPKGSELVPAIKEAMVSLMESGAYSDLNTKWKMPEQTMLTTADVTG